VLKCSVRLFGANFWRGGINAGRVTQVVSQALQINWKNFLKKPDRKKVILWRDRAFFVMTSLGHVVSLHMCWPSGCWPVWYGVSLHCCLQIAFYCSCKQPTIVLQLGKFSAQKLFWAKRNGSAKTASCTYVHLIKKCRFRLCSQVGEVISLQELWGLSLKSIHMLSIVQAFVKTPFCCRM